MVTESSKKGNAGYLGSAKTSKGLFAQAKMILQVFCAFEFIFGELSPSLFLQLHISAQLDIGEPYRFFFFGE